MVTVKPFRLGVVEGFFGKSWSWEARRQYAQFLSGNSFTTYLYAPKNDDSLRKHWSKPLASDHLDDLTRLASHYRDSGVEFGIGLSPFELHMDFSTQGQDALLMKIEEINSINPDTLCILFDDMQGNVPNLADQQLRIMDFVTRHSKARHYIFCPTYYSDDPVLEKHFGKKPGNYLEDLGSHLDSRIDVFWTGPHVFSEDFPEDHLAEIAEKIARKPLLWDNYPVNDSEKLVDRLHLSPFQNRDHDLKQYAQGHISNPMNQASLSQLPLYSLSKLYNEVDVNTELLLEEACRVLCPEKLANQLIQDWPLFEEKGLSGLSDSEKAGIVERYTPYQDHPMVTELFDWLKGEYAFDSECLT